jgi:hypothetical protein
MLSHPCAILDGCFADDAVCIQAFSAVVLSAVLGTSVVGKLGDRFGLSAPSAVFGFCVHGLKASVYYRLIGHRNT